MSVDANNASPKQVGITLVALLVTIALAMWGGSFLGHQSVVDTSSFTHRIDSLNNRILEEQKAKDAAKRSADSLGAALTNLTKVNAALEASVASAKAKRKDQVTSAGKLSDTDLVKRFNEEITKVKQVH